MKRTGAQITWERLVMEGVQTVFGYPGGAILPTYDAMLDYPVHHVLARHEQGATHMADGYARASGKVGVAIATSGPGATNMVTGIATALMDSSPIVCITGQVASNLIGYDAFQEIDITGITLPVTKHNYLVTDVHELDHVLREAFYIAKSGRPGPVLVDIPKDIQNAAIDWEPDNQPLTLPGYRMNARPMTKDLEQACEMIRAAKRPVIIAGHGVLMSGATRELAQLAETTRTPVALTLLGIGAFPAGHPLYLGMAGMHGEAWVNHAIQESDLLIALGMRFDDRITGNLKQFAPQAKKIHFEIDASEVNKNVFVDLALMGDLGDTLRALMPQVEASDTSEWNEHIDEMRRESAVRDIQNDAGDDRLIAPHVIHDLWKHTGGDALVVTDVGQHQMWTAQYYRHTKPYQMITSGGLGTMGFGLPAAIGAKFSRPDANVWAVVGDGGFQMTQAELATAAQEGIKVNVAILNNGYLGMVRQWQEFFYQRRYAATPLSSPNFAKIAEAHGLTGMCVTNRDEVESAIRTAEATEGTVVVDFRVAGEESVYPMVPAGAALHAMIRRPARSNSIPMTGE
jgi:acetolactate synthase-1/2/3 large subunit